MGVKRDFPQLVPSARRYKPGRLPETVFEAQNGATTFVQFGNQFVNAEMSMTFKNIHDWEAAQILVHYRSVRENDWVEFEEGRGLTGIQEQLLDEMDKGDGALRWRYRNPPQVTSVYPGISTVSCEFTGFFYGA